MANRTFALIIGIDDYKDSNVGDLKGSRNDAVHWYGLCAGYLGIPPEQITVLASPRLTALELGASAERSRLGGATRDEVLEGAKWIADALRSGESVGFLTYSGHGVVAEQDATGGEGLDLAICPEDVTIRPAVANVVRFGELASIFQEPNVRDNMTVFLDTCYTGTADKAAPANRHLLGQSATVAPEKAKRALEGAAQAAVCSRLLLSTRHWMAAHEIRHGAGFRGAGSFALATLMQQWSLRNEGGVTFLNAGHGDLVFRTRRLISDLGVDQRPFMWGRRELDDLPFLQRGLDFVPGGTSESPDGQQDQRQMPVDTSPATLVTIKAPLSAGASPTTIVWGIIMNNYAGTAPEGMTTTNEYWFGANNLTGPTLTYLKSGAAGTITFVETDDPLLINAFYGSAIRGAGTTYVKYSQSTPWSTTAPTFNLLYSGLFTLSTAATSTIVLNLGFSPPATGKTYCTFGSVVWAIAPSTAPTNNSTTVFPYAPGSGVVLTPITAMPASSNTWYYSSATATVGVLPDAAPAPAGVLPDAAPAPAAPAPAAPA